MLTESLNPNSLLSKSNLFGNLQASWLTVQEQQVLNDIQAGNPSKPEATESIQTMIDNAAPGEVINIPGNRVYRERIVVNKAITLEGEAGAEIRGSQVYDSWEQRGDGRWRSIAPVPTLNYNTRWEGTDGATNSPTATHPEQVYVDGTYKKRVLTGTPNSSEFDLDANRKIILNNDPRNFLVEATEESSLVWGQQPNVTLRNLQIIHCGDRNVANNSNANWTIDSCYIAHSHFQVVGFGGANGLVIQNSGIHYGGQVPIISNDAHLTISNCEISYGNWEERFDSTWEAGACKISNARTFILEDSEVHHHWGFGFWTDMTAEPQTVIARRNRIHHIQRQGIRIEITQNWLIEDNIFYECGWWYVGQDENGRTAFTAHASFDGTFRNNVIAWCRTGVTIIAHNRSSSADVPNPQRYASVDNVYVDNNVFIMEDGSKAIAWLRSTDTDMYTANAGANTNNEFYYSVDENSKTRFQWSGQYTGLWGWNNNGASDGSDGYIDWSTAQSLLSSNNIPTSPEAR